MVPTDPHNEHPHANLEVYGGGVELAEARAAVLLLHGRGAPAEGMLRLAQEFAVPSVAYLAPQAQGFRWYPESFLAPLDQNEPHLSSALRAVDEQLDFLEEHGIPRTNVILVGFSQGACLSCEYAARHAQRYGGVVGFSGGLIGPQGMDFDYEGSLDETPVFLGCSNEDPHIPEQRVHETAEVLTEMDADVTTRIYDGMGHTVNDDELQAARELVASVA